MPPFCARIALRSSCRERCRRGDGSAYDSGTERESTDLLRLPEEMIRSLFRLTAEVRGAIVPRARTARVCVGRESRSMRGAPESGEVSRRHAGSEHRGSRAAAVPRRRRRRRGATGSGIAACGGSTARDCREVSRRGDARPRAFPMNFSFIVDAASPACGFQVRATDSCPGPLRGLLRRQRHGRADAGPRKHQASSPRERCLLCRSRGIPGPFGNAWTAKVRCRHAISATEGTDRG